MLTFVQSTKAPLGLLRGYAWFFLGFVPLLGALIGVEQATHDGVPIGGVDMVRSIGDFLAVGGLLVVIGGLLAVPAHLYLVRELSPRLPPRFHLLLYSVSGLLALTVIGFLWMYVPMFPLSATASGTLFGIASAWRKASRTALPA